MTLQFQLKRQKLKFVDTFIFFLFILRLSPAQYGRIL